MIKIIFLHFIEIAHTDDFPSTGTWLVGIKMLSKLFNCIMDTEQMPSDWRPTTYMDINLQGKR